MLLLALTLRSLQLPQPNRDLLCVFLRLEIPSTLRVAISKL